MTKTINGKEFMFVEVPWNAYDFEEYNTYQKEIRYFYAGDINPLTGREKIGEIRLRGICKTLDKIKIIGVASELTEDQWDTILGCYDGTDDENIGGKIYECFDYSDFVCDTATQSGLSLISSLGLKSETTLILATINSKSEMK